MAESKKSCYFALCLWHLLKSTGEDALPGDMRSEMAAMTVEKKKLKDKPVTAMSKICQITGKKAMVGNNVSHSKRRTKRKFNVNLFNKKFFWPEQEIWISLTISAAGLRTINKLGLDAAMRQAAEKGYLTDKDIKFIGF